MKRILALILVALIMLSAFTAMAAELADFEVIGIGEEDFGEELAGEAPEAEEPAEDTIGIQYGTDLIVGSATTMAGFFSTDLWGNNTADLDVRALIHGYSTIAWAEADGISLDETVVRELEAEPMPDGSRSYTLRLSHELRYNDGTPITAKDYIFSLLLSGSPMVGELGGTPLSLGYIVGYNEYWALEEEIQEERKEETEDEKPGYVSGLRLIDDHTFSIIIGKDFLNYFYALALLNVTPYPMHVIAPGCDIYDAGEGAYIGPAENAEEIAEERFTPGQFDAAMLAVTMLDEETGYVFYPMITSGPYSLESYDKETHVAQFLLNEEYIGNFEGQKPHIERIAFRPVENETMIQELADGKVGLLNKVTNGNTLAEGMTLVREAGNASVQNYLRTGFAFLSFACEEGVASNEAVRKAIAHSISSSEYVANVVGTNNAMPVYGYYGLGQWMVSLAFEAEPENGKDELIVMDELAKLETHYDLEYAKKLLINDGWTLNAEGEPFAEDVDEIRYRLEKDEEDPEDEGELVPLMIRWCKLQDSIWSDLTQVTLEKPFAELGIGLAITEMPFVEMLTHYYRQADRSYDMFNLASNFEYIFDPFNEYNVADEYQGVFNTTGMRDETLMEIAKSMRETSPADIREYTEKWLQFQERWVELMPMVPLYSNVYFDFYHNELRGYNIAQYCNWAYAIPYAWIGEEEPERLF